MLALVRLTIDGSGLYLRGQRHDDEGRQLHAPEQIDRADHGHDYVKAF